MGRRMDWCSIRLCRIRCVTQYSDVGFEVGSADGELFGLGWQAIETILEHYADIFIDESEQ